MNIRDLQYLVAVHDMNNFSKAAERCYVSQPTLSGQLKKLEEELNAPLIERSTRQVLFTALGEQIVEMARDVLLTVDNIRAAAKSSQDPFAGEFHIGLIPTVGPFLLPILMPVLARDFPNAQIYLYELQTRELTQKLTKGELDAVILAKLDTSVSFYEMPLYQESMKLAVSDQDELAKCKTAVGLQVLKERSVLMLEDGHCLRDQALSVCTSVGALQDMRFKATSMDTLLHMVANGSGMTLIPELACNRGTEGVTYLSFVDPQPSREIVMLMRKQSARKQALEVIANRITDLLSSDQSGAQEHAA